MWDRGHGFLRFKSTKRMRSFNFKQMGINPLQEGRVKLPKIGWVKMRQSRPIPALKDIVPLWYTSTHKGFELKQVRIVRRADGYYCQFLVDADNRERIEPSYSEVGLDVGLDHFYTDDKGNQIENPRFYRFGEKAINRLNRNKSRKYTRGESPQSNNYHKARKKVCHQAS